MPGEYKILCTTNLSFEQIETSFVNDINKISDHYDAISIGGTEDRICVLMRKKNIITSI